MTPKIKLILPNLESTKASLQKRTMTFKPPRRRKMRSHGIDGIFIKGDLVGVYNLTEKRVYYILGRGRAERIIDSFFCQGHKLLQFNDGEENTRYFKSIEQAPKSIEDIHSIGNLVLSFKIYSCVVL